MIPKQDRQGVRKAADIEQKYDLNKDFSEIEKIASNALNTANAAIRQASSALNVADEAKETADGAAEQLSSVSASVSVNTENISALDKRVETLEKVEPSGGDMTKSVYDPQNKATDVFAYVDDKVDGLRAEWKASLLVNASVEPKGV